MPNLSTQSVFWIGGSYSGGKSTTRQLLVDRHRFESYSYDHDLLNNPIFRDTMVKDDDWFWQPNELKFERYRRSFPRAVTRLEKIVAKAGSVPVIAEGPGLLPELLGEIGIKPERVLYLQPAPEFQRKANRQRGAWVDEVLARKSDQQAAWESWMQLDEQFADCIEETADRFGYQVFRNDGSKSPSEIAQVAEQHFGLAP